MTDKKLDQLLKAVDLPPASLPSFTRDVWRDIEHRQLSDRNGRLAAWTSFFDCLALPKLRLAVWGLALSLGIFIGIRGGVKPADPIAIYAHSINPLAPALTP